MSTIGDCGSLKASGRPTLKLLKGVEIRGVGAKEGEVGEAVSKRAHRLPEGALGEVLIGGLAVVGVGVLAAVRRAGADRRFGERWRVSGQLDEVVLASRAADRALQVGDRRHRAVGRPSEGVKEGAEL